MKTTGLQKKLIYLTYTLPALLAWMPPHACAQLPTERPVGILCPKTLPPAADAALFGVRIASEQDFVSMPGHPQNYRLDLSGQPIRQLFIGGNVAHASAGLRKELSGEIDLATDLKLSHRWRFFGGVATALLHRRYTSDGIVSEHPAYGDAIADNRFRYTAGVLANATYTSDGGQRIGFGTRADIATDNKSVSTRSCVFFENRDPDRANAACHTYFVHGFYSHLKTKHYYKAGCRIDLFQRRFAIQAAYEASKNVQTFATGLSISLCKGLTASYDLSLPFRFDGRHAGAAAHTLSIDYRLKKTKTKYNSSFF